MAYRVRFSQTAVADADAIYEWMKTHYSEKTATKWYNGLVDAVQTLKEFPNSFPYAPEREETGMELRQLLYGKRSAVYRVIFAVEWDDRLEQDVVRVFRVWHGARDRITKADLEGDE